MIEKYFPYWIDISHPTSESLMEVANTYKLHHSSIQDILDPEHYPKIEKIDDTLFIILRFFDFESKDHHDDLLSLSRKMAFFYRDGLLITSHRGEAPFLSEIKTKWNDTAFKNPSLALFTKLMKACLESYYPFLEKVEQQIQVL
jgi:magnesium transporter